MSTLFTSDQMKIARLTNLYDFIFRHHMDLHVIKGDSLRLKYNDSVSIKKGYSGYMDWSTSETGNSVDYLKNYLGYSVADAVLALVNESSPIEPKIQLNNYKSKNSEVIFPNPTKTAYKAMYGYLMNKRGIRSTTISMLAEQKLIYQDEDNNIIFINKERDWGERRGTNTYAENRCKLWKECSRYQAGEHYWCLNSKNCKEYQKNTFRGMIKGSRHDGFWWFQVGAKKRADKIYICESAIDAISLYELRCLDDIQDNAAFVSIGGVGKQAAIDRLKCRQPIIAVDNDKAGERCRDANQDCEHLIPVNKDWNEDLIQQRKRF